MCIVLLTTAHPKYALVILDNRDEYILRPTSRPHWWTAHPEPEHGDPSISIEVLSSRDLQREEHGTWLGITKGGNFAVLTNYRETDTHDAAHPVAGKRSRGGMVTAWLGADPSETTQQFVHRMLEGGDVKGVGGFSLICGKLRRTSPQETEGIEPLAIISNRADEVDQVPWICGERNKTYGLSNAIYIEPAQQPQQQQQKPSSNGNNINGQKEDSEEQVWPKVQNGADLLTAAAALPSSDDQDEEQFIESLYKILDKDSFPSRHDVDLEEGIPLLKDSIFIPAFGGKEHQEEMELARSKGQTNGKPRGLSEENTSQAKEGQKEKTAAKELTIVSRPDAATPTPGAQTPPNGFQTGLYGTQRQTVILVDWAGNVIYKERSLWDENGNAIPRGEGDMEFRFGIEGWDSTSTKMNGCVVNGNGCAN